jgi:hypothetical protein
MSDMYTACTELVSDSVSFLQDICSVLCVLTIASALWVLPPVELVVRRVSVPAIVSEHFHAACRTSQMCECPCHCVCRRTFSRRL